MRFENKVYDILKWICMIFIPALSVFYVALDGAFSWGHAETVAVVLAAINTFIGSLIGISTINYNKQVQDLLDNDIFDCEDSE